MDLCKLRQKLVVSISQDIPLVVMYTQRLNHCASCGVSLHSRFCSPGREHHSCQTCGAPKELIREAANTRLSLHVWREWRITFMMGATFVLPVALNYYNYRKLLQWWVSDVTHGHLADFSPLGLQHNCFFHQQSGLSQRSPEVLPGIKAWRSQRLWCVTVLFYWLAFTGQRTSYNSHLSGKMIKFERRPRCQGKVYFIISVILLSFSSNSVLKNWLTAWWRKNFFWQNCCQWWALNRPAS